MLAVTLECAGNGRAPLDPRPVSQPWLLEAVGSAEWTGMPLGVLLDEAGLEDDAVELLFSGIDRGVEGTRCSTTSAALRLPRQRRDEVLLVYEMNGDRLSRSTASRCASSSRAGTG